MAKVPRFREGLKKQTASLVGRNNFSWQEISLVGRNKFSRLRRVVIVESSGIGHCQQTPFKELYITNFQLSNITTEVFDDKSLELGLFWQN